MKIGYTYTALNQKTGGITRYFHEICSRLRLNNKLVYITLFSESIYFNDFINNKHAILRSINFRGRQRILNFLQLQYTKRQLKTQEFDIIHHTGEFSEIFDYVPSNTPVVITIHDMIPEFFYTFDIKRIKNRKECIVNATAIICVSENTKKDLFQFYPNLNKDKVFVIHHGASVSQINYKNDVKNKYILFVGSRYIYKNFIFFINSVADFLKENNLYLICVGGEFTKVENTEIRKLKLENYIKNTGHINDIELANLYHHAECFVYPSLYEGFGLPILEAFQHHCPVCLSNISCFPEIANDAAEYFNPRNSESIINAIKRAIFNRQGLINKGIERMNYFSWENTTNKTMKVYEWAISNNNKLENHSSLINRT